MSTVVITARVDKELGQRLDRLAEGFDRRRSWIIAQAIERYVSEETILLDMVREGEADIAAGRTRTQDEVEEMFKVKRQSRRDAA